MVNLTNLEHYLQPEEITYLREMAKSQGWTYLLKLHRCLETEALKQLQLFQDSNDAFQRRGYANAITLIREITESLYNVVRLGREIKQAEPIDETTNLSGVGATHGNDGNRGKERDYSY